MTGNDLDLDHIQEKWLQPCPPCDASMPAGCTHPDEDYRPTMLALVHEVRAVRAREQIRLAETGQAVNQCEYCGAYRADGQPPAHRHGCHLREVDGFDEGWRYVQEVP